MARTDITPARGFIIRVTVVPPGFLASLERRGLAGMCARTNEGVYLEPRVALGEVISAFERCGIRVDGFYAAGAAGSWHSQARPAASAHRRLTDFRSPTWLPTVPAA
jgi:hypothetical protein